MGAWGGVPKMTGTILGVPTKRIVAFWGLHWGPPNLGNVSLLSVLFCIIVAVSSYCDSSSCCFFVYAYCCSLKTAGKVSLELMLVHITIDPKP